MSGPVEQEELVQKFLDVNPGDEERARFYLEANGWDLNAALSSSYENPPLSGATPPQYREDAVLPPDPLLAMPGPGMHPPAAAPVTSAGLGQPPPPVPAASVPRRRQGSGARIATLSSLGGHDDSSSDDKDSAPPEWYAGGERSGMAVQPPDNNSSDSGSLVDRILRRAAEGGPALGGAPQDERAPPAAFGGRGRTLHGSGSNRPATPSDADSDSDGESEGEGGEVAVRELTFWRNGFSIGDGPLYNLEDPANRQNLEAILQGRAPLDILNVRPGQRVEMKIAERRGEDYMPPAPPPAQPFAGRGQRLGGIAPPIAAAAGRTAPPAAAAPAPESIVLDPAQPTVQVQIRLADGTRLVARVNPSHTVAALRAYVAAQRPDAAARSFVLKAVMPPKVLDDSATITDAGIANATVAQQFV
ncbi:protein phosphatase regulator [Coemansia biformis]|uniref:Protein phosphatase regulator n=1 Tax=Coemansia biformis TaxID=1286918 RepID=A0A9W7YJ46_9FUNG|nr:protein phosphatase regulator [Coemansia biformis]